MTKTIRLLPAFLTVGVWTLLSRVFGFLRDILMAAFLGSGPVAEAFLIAFSLPNMFRRFFAEGAFNAAFVPMFSKRVDAKGEARAFAGDAFSGLATILILFTLVALTLMPWLVLAMASGFQGDERFDLATGYGRLVFPYILFISLAALLSGVLNALGHFAAAAAAPVLLNIVLISALLLGAWFGWDLGWTLATAVPIAGILQLLMLWEAVRLAKFRVPVRRPRMTPEMKRLAIVAGPAALTAGVVQFNLLVGRQVASFSEGAIAWLNYADRLYQLPLGLVGAAIGVVLLPDLARRLQAGDATGANDAYNRATEFSLVLTLPASAALIVIPWPLISVLFERGAFGPEDSHATAAALAIYGLGLPAFVLQKTLTPLYFAREDTATPFRFALVSMVVNLVAAVGLSPFIGYLAAALGTTLAAWANLILLWRGSQKMDGAGTFDRRLVNAAPRMLLASGVMAAVAFGLAALLDGALTADTLRYGALGVVVLVSAVVYGLTVTGLGGVNVGELKRAFRRG